MIACVQALSAHTLGVLHKAFSFLLVQYNSNLESLCWCSGGEVCTTGNNILLASSKRLSLS